jgi:hypothetical protein
VETFEVAPGLWRWTAHHPDSASWAVDARDGRPWPDEVGCVYYEAPDAVCLIDPLVPEEQEDEFFRHLDADVDRLQLPVRILLTAEWHRRSADELSARYDASVDARPLPKGVEEISVRGADERQIAYFIRPHRALVVAEIFAVDRSGVLSVYPSPGLARPNELDASLAELTALPVECLLVSHGEPVLRAAQERMAEAVTLARR